MRAISIVVLSVVASGCATQSESDEAESALYGPTEEAVAIVCKMEKPTGSNRPVKVCRKAPDELDREATKRDMRVLQRQSEIINK